MEHKYPQYFAYEQGKQRRDLPAELNSTKIKLERKLVERGFIIMDTLFFDGQRHLQNKGKLNEWSYVTWYQKEQDGSTSLKCSIGLTHAIEQYDISIPIQKIKRKKQK